jgi:hypothetical protein
MVDAEVEELTGLRVNGLEEPKLSSTTTNSPSTPVLTHDAPVVELDSAPENSAEIPEGDTEK